MALFLSLALRQNQFDGALQGDFQGVFALRNRNKLLVVVDIGTEASSVGHNGFSLVFTERSWQFEEFEGLFQGDGGHALVLRQRGEEGLILLLGCANLHHGAVAADAHLHHLARFRVDAQFALAHAQFVALLHRPCHLRVEVAIELADEARPFLVALGHRIEVLLHVGGEVVVHDVGEVGGKEVVDHRADVRGQEFTLVGTSALFEGRGNDIILREREHVNLAGRTLAVAFHHVFTLLYGRNGGRVG